MRQSVTSNAFTALLITITLFALKGHAAQPKECAFPENDLSYPVGLKASSGINAGQFLEAISQFKEVWGPEIEAKFGKELEIKEKWYSDKVNAHATRDWFNNAVITIHGGMARHPDMTLDGLYLILCHELGHQFGGAPKKKRGNTEKRSWSSAEGQADYFATSKCLPRLFEQVPKQSYGKTDDRLKSQLKKREGKALKKLCDSHVCQRVALASLSVSKMFKSVQNSSKEPRFSDNENFEVYYTKYDHPNPQCRLDTYLAGYFCKGHRELNVDNENANVGFCTEQETSGQRPRCWFHPKRY